MHPLHRANKLKLNQRQNLDPDSSRLHCLVDNKLSVHCRVIFGPLIGPGTRGIDDAWERCDINQSELNGLGRVVPVDLSNSKNNSFVS